MCVNEIAPAPNEMTPPTCPAVVTAADESSVRTLPSESLGALRSPDAQSSATYGTPAQSWTVAAVHGSGTALRNRLL